MKNGIDLRSEKHQLLIVVGFVLILKLILLPLSQTVDADAVSRIYLSEEWQHHPEWIKTSVWAPFHFYLNGAFLWFWDDQVLAPKVLNLLLSVLLLFPFYYFVKREFNDRYALFTTIALGISPILFRTAFMCLSEIPYLLFILLSFNLISKSLKENSRTWMIIAGVCMTIASGFRYEAWLLMFMTGVLLLFFDWKKAFLFGAFTLLFPLIWMYSNYVAVGDPFFSINGNYTWTMDVMSNNDHVSTEDYLRRLWFFPFSLFIAAGPPILFFSMKGLIMAFKQFRQRNSQLIWACLFLIMLVFFMYNSFKGVLLLQHRFSGTLLILSVPFFVKGFTTDKKIKLKLVTFLLLIPTLSFIYNTNGVTPVPRLGDQNKAELATIIRSELDKNDILVLDFVGWEYTYYFALRSGLPKEQIIIVMENSDPVDVLEHEQYKLDREDGAILAVTTKDSPMSNWLENRFYARQRSESVTRNDLTIMQYAADNP